MKWLDRWLILSPIYYGLCLNKKKFKRELKRLKIPPAEWPKFVTPGSHATIHFFDNINDNHEVAIICIKNTLEHSLTDVIGLLTHEAMHLWRAIKNNIGELQPSKEFEAYVIQGLIQNIISALLETNQGKALLKKELKKK